MLEVQKNESVEQSSHDWARATNEWQQKRLEELQSRKHHMRECGKCVRPTEDLELCGGEYHGCQYRGETPAIDSSSRMRHISELISECLADLAARQNL